MHAPRTPLPTFDCRLRITACVRLHVPFTFCVYTHTFALRLVYFAVCRTACRSFCTLPGALPARLPRTYARCGLLVTVYAARLHIWLLHVVLRLLHWIYYHTFTLHGSLRTLRSRTATSWFCQVTPFTGLVYTPVALPRSARFRLPRLDTLRARAHARCRFAILLPARCRVVAIHTVHTLPGLICHGYTVCRYAPFLPHTRLHTTGCTLLHMLPFWFHTVTV